MPNNTPDISGKWRSTFSEDGEECHEIVHLQQSDEKIWGIITLVDDDNPDEKPDKYRFNGRFEHGLLRGVYKSLDESYFEHGAFLMKHSKNNFNGKYIFSSKSGKGEDIKKSDYHWKKIKKK